MFTRRQVLLGSAVFPLLAENSHWGLVQVRDTDPREVILENSSLRVRYGSYKTGDVGVKEAMVELVIKSTGQNWGLRIDSRSARSSKERGNRLTKAELLKDSAQAKTVRLEYGGGTAIQDVTIFPKEPWLEIVYRKHEVNIFDTGARDAKYVVLGAEQWSAVRKFGATYPGYPESYYRREWGEAGPLTQNGWFVLGVCDEATGGGYGRLIPVEHVDVIKLLFTRGFEMFPHYQPRREQKPFVSYVFVVTGGEAEIRSLGSRLAQSKDPSKALLEAEQRLS